MTLKVFISTIVILLAFCGAVIAVDPSGAVPGWKPARPVDSPGDIKGTFSLPNPDENMGLGLMRSTGHLWHVHSLGNYPEEAQELYELDTTGSVHQSGMLSHPGYNLGVACDDSLIYIMAWYNSVGVHVYDQNLNFIGSFPTAAGDQGRGLAWDHTRDLLIVAGNPVEYSDVIPTLYWYERDGTLVDQCDVSGEIQWHMGTAFDECNDIIICVDNFSSNDITLFDGETCDVMDNFGHPAPLDLPEGAAWSADDEGVWTCSNRNSTCFLVDTGYTCDSIHVGITAYQDTVIADGRLSFTAELSNAGQSALIATLSIEIDGEGFTVIDDDIGVPPGDAVRYGVAWPVGSDPGNHLGSLKMEVQGEESTRHFGFYTVRSGIIAN